MKLFLLNTVLFLLYITGGSANPILLTEADSNSLTLNNDVSFNCPFGYSQPANSYWNSCYKVYTNYRRRSDATTKCQSDNGILSSIPNAFVNSYIYSLASQARVTALWLGIQCLNGDQSTCLNDDNTTFTYNNFAPGQPTAVDMCVSMSTTGKDAQNWSTFNCDQNFPFVCEVAVSSVQLPTTTSKTAMTPAQPKKSCPTGWTEFQGYCYIKMDRAPTTEKEEIWYCGQIPGGKLATINSPEMNDFMMSLDCKDDYIRIGLHCPPAGVGDTSNCVWEDGTPFSYNNFAKGEPSNVAPYNCAYYYLGSWYNSHSCNQPFECFACQAPMQ